MYKDTERPARSTLSLHDALPILLDHGRVTAQGDVPSVSRDPALRRLLGPDMAGAVVEGDVESVDDAGRSEEHTSELQSLRHLVCRLLLEKKKTATKRLLRRTNSP